MNKRRLQLSDANIIPQIPDRLKDNADELQKLVAAFIDNCQPLERRSLHLLADCCTDSLFCECHIRASTLVKYGTVDVPLDPEEQAEYRANRELVEDHVAYERMKADALIDGHSANWLSSIARPRKTSRR
jgi:hypothetical protein